MRFGIAGVIGLTLGLAVITAEEVTAQRRGLVDVSPTHGRRGFWLEGGLGWGRESYQCTEEITCGEGRGPGDYSRWVGKPTFSLGLGGTVSPALRLGVEATIWVNSYSDEFVDGGDVFVENVTETLTGVMAVGRFYPSREAGVFLKGGAGLGVTAVSLEFGGAPPAETGLAWKLGAGYEIQVARQLFITPQLEWASHAFEKRNADTLRERLLNLSLAVTWQPGR